MGLGYMAVAGSIINLVLMVLNLIPLPPLDGGRVLTGLLPPRAAFQFAKLERYGLFILLGLIMIPGLLGAIMYWPLAIAEFSLYSLLGRSEERRLGKECVSTVRSRWSTYPK